MAAVFIAAKLCSFVIDLTRVIMETVSSLLARALGSKGGSEKKPPGNLEDLPDSLRQLVESINKNTSGRDKVSKDEKNAVAKRQNQINEMQRQFNANIQELADVTAMLNDTQSDALKQAEKRAKRDEERHKRDEAARKRAEKLSAVTTRQNAAKKDIGVGLLGALFGKGIGDFVSNALKAQAQTQSDIAELSEARYEDKIATAADQKADKLERAEIKKEEAIAKAATSYKGKVEEQITSLGSAIQEAKTNDAVLARTEAAQAQLEAAKVSRDKIEAEGSARLAETSPGKPTAPTPEGAAIGASSIKENAAAPATPIKENVAALATPIRENAATLTAPIIVTPSGEDAVAAVQPERAPEGATFGASSVKENVAVPATSIKENVIPAPAVPATPIIVTPNGEDAVAAVQAERTRKEVAARNLEADAVVSRAADAFVQATREEGVAPAAYSGATIQGETAIAETKKAGEETAAAIKDAIINESNSKAEAENAERLAKNEAYAEKSTGALVSKEEQKAIGATNLVTSAVAPPALVIIGKVMEKFQNMFPVIEQTGNALIEMGTALPATMFTVIGQLTAGLTYALSELRDALWTPDVRKRYDKSDAAVMAATGGKSRADLFEEAQEENLEAYKTESYKKTAADVTMTTSRSGLVEASRGPVRANSKKEFTVAETPSTAAGVTHVARTGAEAREMYAPPAPAPASQDRALGVIPVGPSNGSVDSWR